MHVQPKHEHNYGLHGRETFVHEVCIICHSVRIYTLWMWN